jgi:hypothetical protein
MSNADDYPARRPLKRKKSSSKKSDKHTPKVSGSKTLKLLIGLCVGGLAIAGGIGYAIWSSIAAREGLVVDEARPVRFVMLYDDLVPKVRKKSRVAGLDSTGPLFRHADATALADDGEEQPSRSLCVYQPSPGSRVLVVNVRFLNRALQGRTKIQPNDFKLLIAGEEHAAVGFLTDIATRPQILLDTSAADGLVGTGPTGADALNDAITMVVIDTLPGGLRGRVREALLANGVVSFPLRSSHAVVDGELISSSFEPEVTVVPLGGVGGNVVLSGSLRISPEARPAISGGGSRLSYNGHYDTDELVELNISLNTDRLSLQWPADWTGVTLHEGDQPHAASGMSYDEATLLFPPVENLTGATIRIGDAEPIPLPAN